MRKIAIFAAMLLFPIAAIAAEPAPKAEPLKPSCGKTAEECQKVVDAVNAQVKQQALTIQALVSQRNTIRATADNAEVESYVTAQQAAAAQKK